jgi:hypothetical protein
MKPSVWIKQPWEERKLEFDCANALAVGDSVASVDSVSVLLGGSAQAAMSEGPTIIGNKVYCKIKGGTAGLDYVIRVRVNTTNGDKIEDDIALQIRDL